MLQAPEGLLLVALLGEISALGLLWQPLLVAAPVFFAAIAWIIAAAIASGWRAHHRVPGQALGETLKRRAVTSLLFLLQPFARLAGRLRNGLSPWRRRDPGASARCLGRARSRSGANAGAIHRRGSSSCRTASPPAGGFVRSGGPFDRWDLDLRHGRARRRQNPHRGRGARRRQTAAAGEGLAAYHHRRAARRPRSRPAGARRRPPGEPAIAIAIAVGAILMVTFGLEGMATATRMALARARTSSVTAPSEAARQSVPEDDGRPVLPRSGSDRAPSEVRQMRLDPGAGFAAARAAAARPRSLALGRCGRRCLVPSPTCSPTGKRCWRYWR